MEQVLTCKIHRGDVCFDTGRFAWVESFPPDKPDTQAWQEQFQMAVSACPVPHLSLLPFPPPCALLPSKPPVPRSPQEEWRLLFHFPCSEATACFHSRPAIAAISHSGSVGAPSSHVRTSSYTLR